jgi:dsRNA-specific ribonuclease
MNDITTIESAIGLSFHDRDLLWQALTHTTYARALGTSEAHNEWLAIFGDTLLDLIVVEYLDRLHGNQRSNGFISEQRDKLVNDEALILLAEKIDLHKLIRVKREDDWAKPTLRERISPKDIADSFKALLAAIYIDRGLDTVQSWFVDRFLIPPVLNPNTSKAIGISPISDIVKIEAKIASVFCNKALLQTAITTRSYGMNQQNPENHNQGLALLGDALLDVIVLEYLYQSKGKYGKGKLSNNRDELVKNSTLKIIADRLGLGNLILHSGVLGYKNLTDGVEAILGAIYLDRGLGVARDWFFSQLPKETIARIEDLFYEKSGDRVWTEKIFVTESLISSTGIDYSQLDALLSTGRWQAADLETKEVMLRVIGRVDFLPRELIEEFPCEDLSIIDRLWRHYSRDRFGFSIQVEILNEVGGNWNNFGDRVGWRIDGIWQPKDDRCYDLQAPAGHLPSAAIRAAGKGKARTLILSRLEGCQSC